jgi:hypothetical protein
VVRLRPIARVQAGEESMFGSSRHRGGTIVASGMHTLRIRTDAKNVASSKCFRYLVWLRLVKQ